MRGTSVAFWASPREGIDKNMHKALMGMLKTDPKVQITIDLVLTDASLT